MSRRFHPPRGVLATLTAVLLLAPMPAAGQDTPLDYPQWRGPNRDGSAAAFTKPESWPERLNMR